MTKWLTSLILLLAIGGSVLAGSSGQMAEHGGMMRMRCCRMAQMRVDAPEILRARLCCLVNCPQPGHSGTTITVQNVSPQVITNLHPALLQPKVHAHAARTRSASSLISSLDSQSTYIRNSALLI